MNINSISLYTLNATQPVGNSAQTSSVASLLAISHSIEETVMKHGMDAVFFAGFQRYSAFLPQANRFRRLASRCKKVYVFGVPDSAVPNIENVEYVPLTEDAPLAREWFIIFRHMRFSVALLTREIGSSTLSVRESRFGRGRLYQGLLTLEEDIVQPGVRLLHEALGLGEAPFIPPPVNPIQPLETYLHQFSGYMEKSQSQLQALFSNLSERTAALERMEGIVRTMVSRHAWDDSVAMLENAQDAKFAPQRQNLTIVFTDIESFTQLFASFDPLEMTELLNRYFNLLSTVIYEHHGDIDKFLGDGLMAFFKDPLEAVQAASEIQVRLAKFNRQQVAHLGVQLNTRIGIASGECVVTRFGSATRREITVIGDAVNLASRLQAQAPVNGVGVDESTYRAIGSPALWHGRDISVKGKGFQRLYSVDQEMLLGAAG
jgi:class 3 adenylate cyclase/DICT domain-containing protein